MPECSRWTSTSLWSAPDSAAASPLIASPRRATGWASWKWAAGGLRKTHELENLAVDLAAGFRAARVFQYRPLPPRFDHARVRGGRRVHHLRQYLAGPGRRDLGKRIVGGSGRLESGDAAALRDRGAHAGNYLYLAEKRGARVFAETKVVEPVRLRRKRDRGQPGGQPQPDHLRAQRAGDEPYPARHHGGPRSRPRDEHTVRMNLNR